MSNPFDLEDAYSSCPEEDWWNDRKEQEGFARALMSRGLLKKSKKVEHDGRVPSSHPHEDS